MISAICACASQNKCYRLGSAVNGSVERLSASLRAILCVGSSDLSARDDEVISLVVCCSPSSFAASIAQGAMMLQCDSIQALQPPEHVSTARGVLMCSRTELFHSKNIDGTTSAALTLLGSREWCDKGLSGLGSWGPRFKPSFRHSGFREVLSSLSSLQHAVSECSVAERHQNNWDAELPNQNKLEDKLSRRRR